MGKIYTPESVDTQYNTTYYTGRFQGKSGLIALAGRGTPPPSPLRRGVTACHRPTWPPPPHQYFALQGAAPGGCTFRAHLAAPPVSQFPTFPMAQDKACAPLGCCPTAAALHPCILPTSVSAACVSPPRPAVCLTLARCRTSSASTSASSRSATSTSARRLAQSVRGARHSFRRKATAICQPFWSLSRPATSRPTQWWS